MTRNNREDLDLMIEIDNKTFIPEGIFIDLDGTLFDKITKKPSKKNIEAVRRIQEIIPIIISTGRSYSKKVQQMMKLLNVKYAICQNGALIVDSEGNILQRITLKKEQVDQIIDIVVKNNIGFTINSKFLIYTNHWLWFLFRMIWRNKWKKIDKYIFVENDVNKIVIAGFWRTKKIWNLAKEIENKIKGVSVKTSGGDKIVEVTNELATKGNGDEFVANLLDIDIQKCIHIGDSENDSTTLGKVGSLVAMKDSSTKLLSIATHIGPKHKRGGVSKILLGRFKLEKNE